MILITSQPPLAFAGSCPQPDGEDNDGDGYCNNVDDCNDNNANVNPEHGCNPAMDIENLIGDVVAIIEDENHDINDGQENSIITKLEKAADKIESEHINGAVGSLNAFINQINAFIDNGQILPGAGQALIVSAQAIIEYLLA